MHSSNCSIYYLFKTACWRISVNTNVPFSLLSSIFLTLGAIIAVWGILTVHGYEIINRSYWWKSGPGIIIAHFDSTIITDFIQNRNKSLFALILIVLGFIDLCIIYWFSIILYELEL